MTPEQQKTILDSLIASTEQQIWIIKEIDTPFYSKNALISKEMQAVVMMQQQKVKHLEAYLKYLQYRRDETDRNDSKSR